LAGKCKKKVRKYSENVQYPIFNRNSLRQEGFVLRPCPITNSQKQTTAIPTLRVEIAQGAQALLPKFRKK
jgi:hypothetical protein